MTDREPNPYHPGFNQRPTVLVGREAILEDVVEALEVAAHDARTPRPIFLIGPRGVGKTVTLGEVAYVSADRLSWPTVHVEAKPQTFLLDLVTRLSETAALLDGESPRRRSRRKAGARVVGGKVSAGALGVGGEVHLSAVGDQAPPAEVLGQVLAETATVAIERGTGLVLTLDELHAAPPGDLGLVAAILQENVPNGWPLVVVGAALPSFRINRGPRQLPTYLERALWHDVGPLSASESLQALSGPADIAGRPMSPAAAAELVSLSGGYPYAIQVAGHYAWRESTGQRQIDVATARAARPRIERDLKQLHRGRWDDASARERDYLLALARATATGTATGRGVADEMSLTGQVPSGGVRRVILRGGQAVMACSSSTSSVSVVGSVAVRQRVSRSSPK